MLIESVKEIIEKEIIQSVNSEWKILITDEESLNILTNVSKISDLTSFGVIRKSL